MSCAGFLLIVIDVSLLLSSIQTNQVGGKRTIIPYSFDYLSVHVLLEASSSNLSSPHFFVWPNFGAKTLRDLMQYIQGQANLLFVWANYPYRWVHVWVIWIVYLVELNVDKQWMKDFSIGLCGFSFFPSFFFFFNERYFFFWVSNSKPNYLWLTIAHPKWIPPEKWSDLLKDDHAVYISGLWIVSSLLFLSLKIFGF